MQPQFIHPTDSRPLPTQCIGQMHAPQQPAPMMLPPAPPSKGQQARSRWWDLALWAKRLSGMKGRPQNLSEALGFSRAYRRTASDLARARAFSPDRAMQEELGRIVAHSNLGVYRKRVPNVFALVWRGLIEFPRVVREHLQYHLLAFTILLASAFVAYFAVMYDPLLYWAFVPEGLIQGRAPGATAESLRESLEGTASIAESLEFSAFLFQNNTRVAFLCFALGIFFGIPTMLILIQTGVMLGGFIALYSKAGLSAELFAWLLPHGVPEIGAIVLAGGAGMMLGHRLMNPGGRKRLTALRESAEDASATAMGCVPLLIAAGLIEGIYRQSGASLEGRYLFFAVTLVIFLGYLAFVGSRKKSPRVHPA